MGFFATGCHVNILGLMQYQGHLTGLLAGSVIQPIAAFFQDWRHRMHATLLKMLNALVKIEQFFDVLPVKKTTLLQSFLTNVKQ